MSDDPDDFDSFFRQDYVPLIGFLCKAGFGREEARDAASEAMTSVYRSWLEVKSPRAWVRAAAYRIAVRQAQRDRERFRRAVLGWAVPDEDGTDAFRVVDERSGLLAVLARLTPQQRHVMACVLDGLDTSETAELLGVSEATVCSTLRHARVRLRQLLHFTAGEHWGKVTDGGQ